MKIKPAEFIALSACSMMLTALGIDIMLPAFADLRQHLGLSPDSTAPAQIISFFFLGQVAQIIFGVLSDRFGRIPVLRVGFPLYIASGIFAAFAPNLELLLAARFLAGVGASAVFMTTIAGVRDRFVGDEMARIMSLVFTIFLFTPVLAPFLGMAILAVASWQAVFLTPPLFAIVVFFWSLRLEESLPPDRRVAIDRNTLSKSVAKAIRNKTFLRYTAIATCLFTGLSSYVASSEHIVGDIYGRPGLFAWIFAAIGLLMSLCSLLNSRLSTYFGARASIKGLLMVYTAIASVLLALTWMSTDLPRMLPFFICIALLMAINLAIEPNSSALALEPMGGAAGLASAIYGTFFFSIGSSLGSVISGLMTRTVFPLAVSFFVLAGCALILALGDRRSAE